MLEIFLPEGDYVVCEPVVLDALDIFTSQADIVVREVGVVGRKLDARQTVPSRLPRV